MNSLLQQFYMLPSLRYGILNIKQDDIKKDSLLHQLQNIFSFLQESEKLAYEPFGFCNSYKDADGKPINVHLQQDVDEFFNLLCQRLEAQLKGTPHSTLLSSIFGGKISNEIRSVEKVHFQRFFVCISDTNTRIIPTLVKQKRIFTHYHWKLKGKEILNKL